MINRVKRGGVGVSYSMENITARNFVVFVLHLKQNM